MDHYQWTDVTQQLIDIRKDLKMMQLIKQDKLTLEDCMQAQQINDDKMDPKFDICYAHTIKSKLENNLVKLPNQLNIKQTANVLSNILQLQASTLQGHPYSSSIYTFAYLFDRQICMGNALFTAIIQSIHSLGHYIYDLTRQAGSIKQDDVTISGYSFSLNFKTHDQVAELILQAQKKFQSEHKKNEDKVSFNFIVNLLRLRRSLHTLSKNLGNAYQPKNQKKIQTDLQATKKKILALQQVKFTPEPDLVKGVFFNDLHKTLKVHFGPRVLKLRTLQQSIKQFKNMIEQIQLFLPVPTKISELKNRIQMLQSKTYNGWSKSYIKNSLFAKQNYFFSTVKSEEALIADIHDWVHLTENVKQHQKFINLIKTSSPVINETLYRFLGNSMRWHWQSSKIYEDYNVVVHMANQVDSLVGPGGNKQFYTSSWYYYYGIQLMIKQLITGFQNKLYEQSELKYILYVVQNLLSVCQRNSQVFLKKIDKSIYQNFNDGNFNKKIKKKMNSNQMAMFINIMFKRGLQLYFKAIFKIICILHSEKLLPNKFQSTQQIRVKNRFRIFKNVLFTRIIDYKQYRNIVLEVCARKQQFLKNALQQLKQSKNVFKNLTSQLQDSQINHKQHQDADIVMKLAVKASIIVMTLNMNNTANKKFSVDLSGKYPQFTMS